CERRRIARELQGVAQALLGIQEQGLALRRCAIPARSGIAVAVLGQLQQLEPGVVLAPSFLELPVEEERKREIPTGVREIALERKRVPEGFYRSRHFVRRLEHEAKIVPGRSVIGFERERSAIFGDRIDFSIGCRERKAQIVVELWLFPAQRDRMLEQRQGFGEVAALVVNHTEEVLSDRIAGFQREHFRKEWQRRVAMAVLVKRTRLLESLREACRGCRGSFG